ncbi:Ken-052 [Symbiodinium necroappetens]|uniref:Ken-052 protein n=1 Tax=Symbiodinium necroappetens TaxID=1628268 RepID=A0A812Q504_9DINO|nr:Ken-052 [Symbiodinium necroappetens]
MGKFRVSKKGDNPFALPKRKVPKKQLPGESEANRRKKEDARQKEAEAKAAREKRKAEEAARPPGKKLGPGKARLEKMVQEGKVTKTDQDVEELLQCKDEVVCALADVQDEAELRKKFGPSQGTSGYGKEFFEASCYRFRYMQAKDGTPVAQIYKWPWP